MIRDTSHVPIAPYVPAAAVGLVHHASRAVFSAALVVKTCTGCAGGGGGGGDGQVDVSVLHDGCGELPALDHTALLTWTDQLVAMRALLHALRLLALAKVPCRAKGMRVRARVWWGGGWWRECKGASVWRCGAVGA